MQLKAPTFVGFTWNVIKHLWWWCITLLNHFALQYNFIYFTFALLIAGLQTLRSLYGRNFKGELAGSVDSY